MINSFVSSRLPLLLLCICTGISVGACTQNVPIGTSSDALEQSDGSSIEDEPFEEETLGDEDLVSLPSGDFEPFREAVNTALAATELNETAETTEDWREVAIQWTRAIELMKAVPKSHEKYDIAQQRALEAYPKNLAYAQGKAGEDSLPEFTVDDAKMTKVDFGEGWPFVVDGEIMCERISSGEYVVDLVTLHSIDRVYAVNLPAQSRSEENGWKEIDDIWRDSPFGSGKVPINWVIWRGEDLCDNPLEAPEIPDSDDNDDDNEETE